MRKSNYFIGIFLISLATLLLELSLTRVMSVALWYHFGFLVISTALLGFGTAGVVLAIWKNLREKYDLDKTLATLSLLFGFVTLLSFWLLQKIPFNPFSLATDKQQLYILPLYYLTIAAPFFISGLVLSLLFTRVSKSMSRLYAFDLVGAALGCLLIVWAMPTLGGSGSVVFSAAMGVTAAIFFSSKPFFRIVGAVSFLAITALAFYANDLVPIKITSNKRPATFTRVPIYTKWNTFSFIELYDNKPIPARKIEGSRRFLIDGGTAATGMVDLSEGVEQYLEKNNEDSLYESAITYRHIANPSVLNIGSGGGSETLDALHKKARRIVSVDINPIINDVVKNKMNDYWGGMFRHPAVELVTGEARNYINHSAEKFDVIVSSHTISNAAVASGSLSLSENFVLTREAFEEYYDHLSDNGILFFTRPESQLPRLFTTAREVLAENGIKDFSKHFYAYRSHPSRAEGKFSFVGRFVMKKSPFTKEEITAMDSSISKMHQLIDSVWRPLENLYHPYSNQSNSIYKEILNSADLASLYKQYPFQIAPATDDKPFFNQHVRWSSIGWSSFKDVFSQNNSQSARMALENKPIAEVTLVIILLQSVLLGGLLILIPLFRYSRSGLKFPNRWRYLGYFAALGLGFIMVEIAFIQRFTLYLGQPVYTLAVIIAGLLLFTGIGAFLADKMDIDRNALVKKWLPVLLIVLLLTTLLTPVLFNATLHWSLELRILLSLLLLAPLGIFLGMPFPTGIKTVSKASPDFIPWAWGVNGFFTVIGSVSALILGMILGFKMVILLAGICYLLAIFLLPKENSSSNSSRN